MGYVTPVKISRGKLFILIAVVILYILFGVGIRILVGEGLISPLPPTPVELDRGDESMLNSSYRENLDAAQEYFEKNLVEENGHVNVYKVLSGEDETSSQTNSEAASYYLLVNSKSRNKQSFDKELNFINENMIHPSGNYIMWRLEGNDEPVTDGVNIASDADIRAIKALAIADENWEDEDYKKMINQLADSLEEVALTEDNYLAPYGGIRDGGEIWTADEVWLSYGNFEVFRYLALERGYPWRNVYYNMKDAVLDAQLENGLYNTRLDETRNIGNLDEGYSINSLWVMVRAAESGDKELMASAEKGLEFYKRKYSEDGLIYASYDSSGEPIVDYEASWAYALIGRTAVVLDDESFAKDMIGELTKIQIMDKDSELYGAIPEGSEDNRKVGQFTMQESILTMQDYLGV